MTNNRTPRIIRSALITLAAVLGGGLATSSAFAECVTRNAGDIRHVAAHADGWIMIGFPPGTFNDVGILSVAPGSGDGTLQRLLAVANAAFLSGAKVHVCRTTTATNDPWGRKDRLIELRILR